MASPWLAACATRTRLGLAIVARSPGRTTAKQGRTTSGSAAMPTSVSRRKVATVRAGARPSNRRAATHALTSTSMIGPATIAATTSLTAHRLHLHSLASGRRPCQVSESCQQLGGGPPGP
jgi:hypothetical protein